MPADGSLPNGQIVCGRKNLDGPVVGQQTQRFSQESLQNQPLALKYAPRECPSPNPGADYVFVPFKTGLLDPVGSEFQTSSFDASES